MGPTLIQAARQRITPAVGRTFRLAGTRTPHEQEKPAKSQLPSAGEQFRNATAAAVRTFKGLVRGRQVIAPTEEQERRHAICRSGECGLYLRQSDRCARCGCYLQAKAWLALERCPVGRW